MKPLPNNKLPNNKLAIFKTGCEKFPKTAISLLDIMREFKAGDICYWVNKITSFIQVAKLPRGALLPPEQMRGIYDFLCDDLMVYSNIVETCQKMGWEDVEIRVHELNALVNSKQAPTAESTHRALVELNDAISVALDARKFVEIENLKADFLERKNLFGKLVHEKFPSARREIMAAGNCLAWDLNTAAVFHLMRAAEFGMRALAGHLKVKLKRKPIEHGGWNELIEQIEKKIRLRRERYDQSRKKNKKELESLKFYRMMADELFIFKEIWRNNTMHSISSYNEAEAKGVFDRVRNFMQRLSKEVSETNN